MAAEEKDPEKREASAPISGWLFQKSWVFHREICRWLEADALGRVEEKAGNFRGFHFATSTLMTVTEQAKEINLRAFPVSKC